MGEDDDFDERKNTGRCVVAVPTATEPIHHLGDAAEPKHLTVLWLGKPDENPDLDMEAVKQSLAQAAEQVGPLTAPVAEQGPLGDEGANVAFLHPDAPTQFRDSLLADPVLQQGVDAVEQYPGYTPHVTLDYSGNAPVADEELPAEVIFDRLALWDGDEHTEFPIGPSASSAETTDVMDGVPAPAFSVNGEPLVVNDIATLTVACAYADRITDAATQAATRRVLTRRARQLSCQHVIPSTWLRQAAVLASSATSTVTQSVTDAARQKVTDVPDLFALKTELSRISDTALRTAYMRGVRDFTMTAAQSRPPLPRDVFAQARVNSLIRLSQGDLSARTDDQDLLR